MNRSDQSLLTTLLANRHDEAAARATLLDAQARADALEPWLRAFMHRPDTYAVRGAVARALVGVPIGVKDLADTADMPTGYGSPAYNGHRPGRDARIVSMIRALGGTVFGKTATTEFAWRGPAATVNPWNRAHTPGGSSSGSAAAVAAGIVPLAIGTQTVGSIIRPAAYCGIVGYKPSYRAVPSEGVHPLAASLDHVGFFGRSVEDVAVAHALFVEGAPQAVENEAAWRDHFPRDTSALTLGVVRTPFWDELIAPHQHANFDASLRTLSKGGARIVELDYGADLPQMREATLTILAVEAYRAVGDVAARAPALMSEHMRVLLSEGQAMPLERYQQALLLQAHVRSQSAALLQGCDALVTLPASGEAPHGHADTGDARFCAPWSLMGAPAVNVPSGWSDANLPLGFQIVGAFGDDAKLLRVAARIESMLKFERRAVTI
ncbi:MULTISPECIES: amidase [unclassified Paraburkholderia]|uniref:amidase n=1 Tax=unclassified Paraburkholderia TaxID=2615204 RepID=UPI001614D9AC|nr:MULTISPECIES: amidase [unclassified Paraburkholderia]MBB5444392.1 Asp-tRNA(Asn)/Glu-tRNA(Gln) amidotransferase A subunit family amidase [Paraburkholderia sp. WSM4177]MBB5485217.1 Asp-tRNA(Asn)/Glu-tRNA(Gln) amidotransferase A subunit family amidase [Paraburkholderia sp. WSM4180]